MRFRKHHNNKGHSQIKRGKTRDQVERMAKKILGKRGDKNASNDNRTHSGRDSR